MSDNDAINDTNITSFTKKTNATEGTEGLSVSNIDEYTSADIKKSKILELDDGGSDVSVLSSELIGSARNTLYASVILLLGEVMGTGVLSLPNSASKIGWGMSITAIIVFALAAYYSSRLLSEVKQKYPGVKSYADAAYALNGRTFGLITEISMLLNWGALMIYFVISTVSSIALITDQYDGVLDCNWEKSLVACFLILIPIQCRDYHTISFLCLPSTIAIIIVVILVLENVSTKGEQFGVDTEAGPNPDLNFIEVFSSFSSFVFAYQGQSIYFEMMSEMKEPSLFPKAAAYAYGVMVFVYGITVIVAYGYEGSSVAGFLPDSMSDGALKIVASVLIIFHVLVAYVIAGQPFHYFLHQKLFPKTLNKNTTRGRVDWFIITSSYLVFAFIISNAVPFFSDIQNLIGSLFGAPIVFGWPVIFYVSMLYHEAGGSWQGVLKGMGYWHTLGCGIFFFVCLPLFCIVGTISGVFVLVSDVGNSGKPFSC